MILEQTFHVFDYINNIIFLIFLILKIKFNKKFSEYLIFHYIKRSISFIKKLLIH